MCYSVYLSTDSDINLSKENTTLLFFEKSVTNPETLSHLKYENKWFVGSKSRCSCTFRHLYSIELGFGEPATWSEEPEDDIAATLAFIRLVRQLVEEGYQVDCLDTWGEDKAVKYKKIKVDLMVIKDAQFRFFENYYFQFTI